MLFTFSYTQEKYAEKREPFRQYLRWKNKDKIWDYQDCTIDVIGMTQNQTRIIVRRKFFQDSTFMGKNFEVNLMMGFVITGVTNNSDSLEFTIEQSKDKHYGQIRDKHRELKDVKISGTKNDISNLYQKITNAMGNSPKDTHIFSCELPTKPEFLPVIYQPKIDAWNNFLREINVHKNSKNYEITLVFEGEELRKHVIFHLLYKAFRLAWYHRTKDIETFYVDFESTHFTFPGIYSDDDTLFDDSTHNDKDEPVKKREIKYHYQDSNHGLDPSRVGPVSYIHFSDNLGGVFSW